MQLGALRVCASVPDKEPLDLAVCALTPSGAMNAATASIVKLTAEAVDVVKPTWLEACAATGRRVPLEPCYIVHASLPTREAFPRWVDAWGGSLTRSQTPREFSAYWQRIPVDQHGAALRRAADDELIRIRTSGTASSLDRCLEVLYLSSLTSSQLCAGVSAKLPPADATEALLCVRRPGTFRGAIALDTLESSAPASGLSTGNNDPVVVFFYHPPAAATLPDPSAGTWCRVHAALVLAGGGLVAPSLESAADVGGADVVVVQRAEVTRADLALLRASLKGRSKLPAVVWAEWVTESSALRSMQPLRPYLAL